MPQKKKATESTKTPIDSIKHGDKRSNVPTSELSDFLSDDDRRPTMMRYPRDPSLDPQLVWDGKDAENGEDLEVPTVPLYVQEEINPHALIEDFRREVARQERESEDEQIDLFSTPFADELEFEQKVDFYRHDSDWANRMILGDSLVVMNSLAEKEGLRGKVQCIYIDPPYGIKFGSNWQVSTLKRDVKDGKLEEVTRQPEQVRAFRDTWEKGIHSYLSYLRDRLVVARELLTESGSCFVQIGDENVHLVRCLMDEVFGSENFVSLITFQKSGGTSTDRLQNVSDFIIWYSKNGKAIKYKKILQGKYVGEVGASKYTSVELKDGTRRSLKSLSSGQSKLIKKHFRLDTITSQGFRKNTSVPFSLQGKVYDTGTSQNWKTSIPGMYRLSYSNRIEASKTTLNYVRFLEDYPAIEINSIWTDIGGIQSRNDPKVYVVQTATEAIKRCILMTTDPGDLVLDPTCGSGTTAYVAEQWGRRWITIDTSRVALALARTRLMSAKYPYYLLQDSPEGQAKTAELKAQPVATQPTHNNIKKGFVYRTVPHIKLQLIANNEEIDEIYDRWQQKLEPIRAQLNNAIGQTWEDWEIPRDPDNHWDDATRELHQQWWKHRRDRQTEIDASIARRADQETLYDQPYEDKKRIRVSGRFTVESLAPYRVLNPDSDRPNSERAGTRDAHDQFESRIIENLLTAGVQNTKKGERLIFETLELSIAGESGEYIHAIGQYTDSNDQTHEVAVHIGPEYGTVSRQDIRKASRDAARLDNVDTLIVCGFAFEAKISEDTHQIGKLTVLTARMHGDLLLGDQLKKTKSANLFTVFGEPDIELKQDGDRCTIELKGLDIYDPTTGAIRSSSTEDIAAWFIDTRYNEENFVVRHAYFTGANKPYEKLQKTLKAEIDPDAWSALYSDVSRSFPKPDTGKIAVKVINHYGDEVLKILSVN